MWLYLRNIVTLEQIHFPGANPSPDLKRTARVDVLTRAVLLGTTMVALGTPVASHAVSAPPSHAAVPDPRRLAVEGTLPGAQPPSQGGANRQPASDRPGTSVMQMALGGVHKLAFVRNDLHPRPPVAPLLGESVLVTLFRLSPSVCAPLAPSAGNHEWAGRVVAGTGKTVNLANSVGSLAPNAAHPTLSGGAALDMPPAGMNTYAGEIKGGSRATWTPVGLPADLAAQLGRIFVGHLDTSKPVQAGDYYRIAYERLEGAHAGATGTRITAVELRLAGKTYRAVWFAATGQAAGNYYSFDGQRLVAEPFSMPLNYVRVSSPFGYRIHPVTGQRLLHTGVDLTAAPGTPVVAASAGTVQFVGYDSGYGNHVVLRHTQGYTSYYAHLSAFAKGLRVGMKVSQGQSLGAVGETGVATGPHLHFEVRLNNQPTDPLKLTSRTSAVPLAGRQRAAFDQSASVALAQLPASLGDIRTASNAPLSVH